jgi:hypothetical protein
MRRLLRSERGGELGEEEDCGRDERLTERDYGT